MQGGLFQGLIMGLLLTILLPVAGLFVAIPLGLIMLFIMFSFPIILFLYFITKSPMMAMIMWGSLGFFIGFLMGIFVLVAVGMLVMGPIGLAIFPMLLMTKSTNPLILNARNRTHARKKANAILGADQKVVGVRRSGRSSNKYRVYHKDREGR